MRTAEQFHEGKDPVFRQITADAAFLRNLLKAAEEKQKDSENDTVSLGTRVEAAYDAALNICFAQGRGRLLAGYGDAPQVPAARADGASVPAYRAGALAVCCVPRGSSGVCACVSSY